MFLFLLYSFIACGLFGLMIGIVSEDLKVKDVPMLLLLAVVWPYVVYLWIKDHYFDKE